MSVAEIRPAIPSQEGAFERQPPQDVDAEMSVLGGMLLSAEATADVVEVLRENDFYRPAHQLIFASIVDLYTRGEPVDAITISAELARAGTIARVGGAPYLHTLVSSVPTAANAGYYARIVADKSVLRRLVEAGTRIVQLGYSPEGAEVSDVVDRAQAAIYDVTEARNTDDFMLLEQLLVPTLDEIEAIQGRDGTLSGVPTGFADLDRLTNGLHPGQMIIIAARPSLGKSTLALDFCRAASLKHDLPSVFFSLEMSRSEIVMRLLSAEARIGLGAMRTGRMNDDDWARLARRMGEVSDKPLFIDDSPNLTMMEIRSKARRLKQRHGLRLIVVDYLQLMSSPRKVESRQQEVSEISRSLKLLAKELEVPIVCLSQLNRNSEQRADRRPMISDLRESGCLTAETRVLRADTGAETTIGELHATKAKDVEVWALDKSLRFVRRTMTHVFSTGVRPVFRLRLASGRELRATANHPFLTYDGWSALGALTIGARIAAPRHIPAPTTMTEWDDRAVVMLAHLLGDGSCVRRQPIRYASVDEANLAAVSDAARYFGITPVREDYPEASCITLHLPAPFHLTHGKRNPIAAWLDGLGLFGARSHEKFVPEAVFSLPKRQVTLFLRHLWATDGCVHLPRLGGGTVYYASTSRRLADDVARLLWRFGIQAQLKTTTKAGYRDSYHVHVSGASDQRAFCRVIGAHGARGALADQLFEVLDGIVSNTNVDTVPVEVWDRVREILQERNMPHRESAAALGVKFSGSGLWKHAPSRDRLARVASVLDADDLELLAMNDVTWDSVVAIEPDGVEEVFDATVLGEHNFVANGIVVHNSIEQDADMVILLHREDVYEKESPRAGEADLIVAKHRNGPTDTVTVAFQGHYSRFTDMVASS